MTSTDSDNDLAALITELLNAQEAMVERIEALEHELARRPRSSSFSDLSFTPEG